MEAHLPLWSRTESSSSGWMNGRSARDMANELGFLFRLPPWLAEMFDTGVGETRGLGSYVVGERGVIELD